MYSFIFLYYLAVLFVFVFCTGQTRIFNESEMYQRAFLHWNRAAIQGDLTLLLVQC